MNSWCAYVNLTIYSMWKWTVTLGKSRNAGQSFVKVKKILQNLDCLNQNGPLTRWFISLDKTIVSNVGDVVNNHGADTVVCMEASDLDLVCTTLTYLSPVSLPKRASWLDKWVINGNIVMMPSQFRWLYTTRNSAFGLQLRQIHW